MLLTSGERDLKWRMLVFQNKISGHFLGQRPTFVPYLGHVQLKKDNDLILTL